MRLLYLFSAIILLIAGIDSVLKDNMLGLFGIGFAIILLMSFFRRSKTNKHNVRITLEHSLPRADNRSKRNKLNLKPIGNVDSNCPNCNTFLKKRPGRKAQCPYCGEFIYVRTRPNDNQRVLVTKYQTEKIEEQWSIVNGTYKEYLAKKKLIADERKKLEKRFNSKPSENDVKWSLLNKDIIKHSDHGNWGLFRNTKSNMAEIFRKKLKFKDALSMYFDVCYLDINGPNNIGNSVFSQQKPWDPKQYESFAPIIIKRIALILKKTETNQSMARRLFFIRANRLQKSLELPVSADKAWVKIEKALWH